MKLTGNVFIKLAGNVLVKLAGNVFIQLAGNVFIKFTGKDFIKLAGNVLRTVQCATWLMGIDNIIRVARKERISLKSTHLLLPLSHGEELETIASKSWSLGKFWELTGRVWARTEDKDNGGEWSRLERNKGEREREREREREKEEEEEGRISDELLSSIG